MFIPLVVSFTAFLRGGGYGNVSDRGIFVSTATKRPGMRACLGALARIRLPLMMHG